MDDRQKTQQNIPVPKSIRIRGAKVHNLKNINVDVPLNQIVGIAGVSGSGEVFSGSGVSFTRKAPAVIWSLSPPTPDGE